VAQAQPFDYRDNRMVRFVVRDARALAAQEHGLGYRAQPRLAPTEG
jgi:hypothetical protein